MYVAFFKLNYFAIIRL